MTQNEKNLPGFVVDIYEDEFGCEGRPDGETAMVTVVVKDALHDEKHFVRMPDQMAYDWDLKEGDRVELTSDGMIRQIK